jgi:hypothetical protein
MYFTNHKRKGYHSFGVRNLTQKEMTTAPNVSPLTGVETSRQQTGFESSHFNPRVVSEDFFNPEAVAAQQAALGALAIPEVSVVRRVSHGEPERVGDATVFQESVRFSDGAVRLATIVEHDNPASDVWWSSADPFVTGDEGVNRDEIGQMMDAGLNVGWLHHQGRHSISPTSREHRKTISAMNSSKGIAKWAAQEAAFMRSVLGVETFDGVSLARRGYSRSGQSGNAFAVMVEAEGGKVEFSHHEAEVFPDKLSLASLAAHVGLQLGIEAGAIVSIAKGLVGKESGVNHENGGSFHSYSRTFDFHVLNVINEALCIDKFRSGEAGKYARAVGLDARGIRLHYERDGWAKLDTWLDINDPRPGIVTVEAPGAHSSGASPEMMATKATTFRNIGNFAREHDGDISTMTAVQVLPDELKPYIIESTAAA